MGKASRLKGKKGERWLARRVRAAMTSDMVVKRGIQSRDGGEVPDVDSPMVWWEMKRGKLGNPRAALAQAIEATDGRMPIAVIKDDRKEAFAALRLADLLALIHTVTHLSCDPEGAIEASRRVIEARLREIAEQENKR